MLVLYGPKVWTDVPFFLTSLLLYCLLKIRTSFQETAFRFSKQLVLDLASNLPSGGVNLRWSGIYTDDGNTREVLVRLTLKGSHAFRFMHTSTPLHIMVSQ